MKLGIVPIAAVAVLVVGGCGDESATGPGNGGETMLISGANRERWTVENTSGTPFWEDGAFRVVATTPAAPPGCDGSVSLVTVSVDDIDVKPYSTVRARFNVRLALNSPVTQDQVSGEAAASVQVTVNEPGAACCVSRYHGVWSLKDLGAQGFTEEFDILLEHPQDWDRAPVLEMYVRLHCYALTRDGVCADSAVAEISDFRIVGVR